MHHKILNIPSVDLTPVTERTNTRSDSICNKMKSVHMINKLAFIEVVLSFIVRRTQRTFIGLFLLWLFLRLIGNVWLIDWLSFQKVVLLVIKTAEIWSVGVLFKARIPPARTFCEFVLIAPVFIFIQLFRFLFWVEKLRFFRECNLRITIINLIFQVIFGRLSRCLYWLHLWCNQIRNCFADVQNVYFCKLSRASWYCTFNVFWIELLLAFKWCERLSLN